MLEFLAWRRVDMVSDDHILIASFLTRIHWSSQPFPSALHPFHCQPALSRCKWRFRGFTGEGFIYGFEDRLTKSVQRCLSISILRAMLAGFDEQ